ncbi:deoxyribonuclease-2-beta [Microtus ochrogaster]|uniref:Deoxyribonuclease-2-beta n=1 Tax=Microtus ochrogaster TaxID=79684 RepID=A0ABM0L280_MICOH|nr:deoxyribonuclease-2-beta [Microtus ochrogaster]
MTANPLRTALALLLFALSGVPAMAEISCRSENGEPVDWVIFYKVPKVFHKNRTGLEYLYLDSLTRKWMKSNHLINNNKSILGRTLEPLYEAYNSKSNNTAYLIYNDGVPTSMNYSRKYGHTKGLLVWNRIQGIWLIHSVPRFPPVPKDGYDYPSSGRLYGQSGICITFKYSQYKKIDFQLFVSQPNIYSCSIPDIFHQEIVHMTHMCAKSGSLNIPGRRLATLQSAQGLVFFHFAKSSLYTDDIFTGWMAQSLKTPLLAQTWQRRNHELPSNCSLRYHVYNINYIRLDRKHSFSSYHDHSKWCVSRNFNNHWTCIGDLNRDPHQAFRGGGFICTMSWHIYQSFYGAAIHYEKCS